MKLYYTIKSGEGDEQKLPGLSLGGYQSGNSVPNARLNNLFGDITLMTINKEEEGEYIGLILKNETGAAVTGVKLWFEYPDGSYAKYEVGAVTPSSRKIESISSIYEQPLYADFYEADGETNAVSIGDMVSEAQLGIWIRRTLNADFIEEDQDEIYEVDPTNSNRYVAIELDKTDDIKIKIQWD